MRVRSIVPAVMLLVSSSATQAQTYGPASGQSPLVLMEVPPDGVAYYEAKERARALLRDRQWAQAEPLVERLASEYRRDPENWMMLGRARFWLGKGREAAAAWERAGPLIGWDLEYANGYRMAMGCGTSKLCSLC